MKQKHIKRIIQVIIIAILMMTPILGALNYFKTKSLGPYTIYANPIEITDKQVNTLSANEYLKMMNVQIYYKGTKIDDLPTINIQLVKDLETVGYDYPIYLTYQGITMIQYVKVIPSDPSVIANYKVQTSWYVKDKEIKDTEIKLYQLNETYEIESHILSEYQFIGYRIDDDPTLYTGIDKLLINKNMHIQIQLEPYIHKLSDIYMDIYDLQAMLKNDSLKTIIQKQLNNQCDNDVQLVQTDRVGVYPVLVSCETFNQVIQLHISEQLNTLIAGQDTMVDLKHYQSNDIVTLMQIQAFNEGAYSKVRTAIPYQVDTSKVKEEVGIYPVIIHSENQTKTIQLQITKESIEAQSIEPIYIRYDEFAKKVNNQEDVLKLLQVNPNLSPAFTNYEADLRQIEFLKEDNLLEANTKMQVNNTPYQTVKYLSYDFPYEIIIAISILVVISIIMFLLKHTKKGTVSNSVGS